MSSSTRMWNPFYVCSFETINYNQLVEIYKRSSKIFVAPQNRFFGENHILLFKENPKGFDCISAREFSKKTL